MIKQLTADEVAKTKKKVKESEKEIDTIREKLRQKSQAIAIHWFFNEYSIESDKVLMVPFDYIDSITLDWFHKNFVKSNGDPQFRIVVLGSWTVDIKYRLKFLTDDPDDTKN